MFWLRLALSAAAAVVATRPASFVRLSEIDPSIRQEMRYYGSDNFVGAPIDGYLKPQCWLAKPAADALALAQKAAKQKGLSFKVFDCYRPQRAVSHFVRWAKDLKDLKQKARFYPKVPKEKLFVDGYIASQSGHSRGATVDLTLTKGNGEALDMGTPFDFFDPIAHTDAPSISAAAKANRKTLVDLLSAAGFRNYEKEWWHYTLAAEPFSDSYFDFPVD